MHKNRSNSRPSNRSRVGDYPQNAVLLLEQERNLSESPRRSKVDPKIVSQFQENLTSFDGSKFADAKPLINLQQVLYTEEKLWMILESLRKNSMCKALCEEYWEASDTNPVILLETLYREGSTKTTLRQAFIVEIVAVGLANVCFLGEMPFEFFGLLRNLFYYVHQNYLCFMKLLLQRCSCDAKDNLWCHEIKQVIQQKQSEILKKAKYVTFIKKFTSVILKIFANVCEKLSGPVFSSLQTVLREFDIINYSRARWLMEVTFDNPPSSEPYEYSMPAIPPAPYLPPVAEEVYTLVLDLDETLVHYVDAGENSNLLVRPGSRDFLKEMAKYYEIVIFTAALQDYADWAIDIIDDDQVIKHRLYRQHTIPSGHTFLKDLERLGRDLSRTIILDNVADNFKQQTENGVFVKSWYDDAHDTCLVDMMPLLREMVVRQVQDVRVALRFYRDQVLRQLIKGVQNPHLNLQTSINIKS